MRSGSAFGGHPVRNGQVPGDNFIEFLPMGIGGNCQ